MGQDFYLGLTSEAPTARVLEMKWEESGELSEQGLDAPRPNLVFGACLGYAS